MSNGVTGRSSGRMLWAILAVALLMIGGFALFTWMKQEMAVKLPNYGTLPKFTMTNQDGKPVGLDTYKGHIWIADLIFTHCSSICPALTHRMAELQKELKDQPDVKLVSFSVDPKNDQPDTLARYAELYNADTKQWSFLTGAVPTTYTVIKAGFHLPLDSVGGDQASPIIHSPRFVLVDTKGRIRAYYDGQAEETRAKILADIKSLREEKE